jgi:hypothetical protein
MLTRHHLMTFTLFFRKTLPKTGIVFSCCVCSLERGLATQAAAPLSPSAIPDVNFTESDPDALPLPSALAFGSWLPLLLRCDFRSGPFRYRLQQFSHQFAERYARSAFSFKFSSTRVHAIKARFKAVDCGDLFAISA